MAHNNANQPITVAIHLGSLTSDGTLVPAISLPKKSEIVSAKLMNGANVLADNSNYCQLALKKGNTVIAEIDTREAHENGLAANVAKEMNLVEGQEVQEAGDLTALYNETGTVALTDAKLILTYFPR